MTYESYSKIIREQHATYIGGDPKQLVLWLEGQFEMIHERLSKIEKALSKTSNEYQKDMAKLQQDGLMKNEI